MFHGSMVALVTPMQPNGDVDWQALHNLVQWHLEQGTHAIVAVGTTGESATLNVNEHIQVIKSVVEQVAGRIPVIAGTGANSTSEAIELTQAAATAKVDGCLLVTPYYNKPTQEGLFLHHQAIAKAVAIPQLLYNVPGRTAVDMLPETAAKLSYVDNIVGIKEATGDISRVKSILDNAKDGFLLISGDDETAVDFIHQGGVGEISVTANVAPKLVATMCELAAKGEIEQAHAINNQLMPLHDAMFVESSPIPVKWALNKMQRIQDGIRLPLTALSEQHHATVEQALKLANAL